MAEKKDPLAESLNAVETKGRGGSLSDIERHFGDRPAVKEAIIAAHKRRLSNPEIAKTLNQEPGVSISAQAVGNWLKKQGL